MVLEGIPPGSLDLVTVGEQVPGEEAREVLDGTVGLQGAAGCVSGCSQGMPEVRTLSRPRVVLQVLRDWETTGWKTTCAATVDMVVVDKRSRWEGAAKRLRDKRESDGLRCGEGPWLI